MISYITKTNIFNQQKPLMYSVLQNIWIQMKLKRLLCMFLYYKSNISLCHLLPWYEIFNLSCSQRRIQVRRAGRNPRFKKIWGVICINFDCITRIFFDFGQNTMLNIYFIHYSYDQNIGYVWRGFKTNPRPRNSTTLGLCPPVLKFLDLPLLIYTHMKFVKKNA